MFSTPEIGANPAAIPPIAHAPATSTTTTIFQINSTKIYVPVVTLSINDSIKFLQNLRQGFKSRVQIIASHFANCKVNSSYCDCTV